MVVTMCNNDKRARAEGMSCSSLASPCILFRNDLKAVLRGGRGLERKLFRVGCLPSQQRASVPQGQIELFRQLHWLPH